MSDLLLLAKEQLNDIIVKAIDQKMKVGELPQTELPKFNIEIPADIKNGDFSSNVAMVGAKSFRLAPIKIAQIIVDAIDLNNSYFEKVEIAGAGFMNFFVSQKWFSDVLCAVAKEQKNYGHTNLGAGKKIMVEFVSANPTGPMHIGNARGGAIGDCLSSVFEWAGYDVTREFYVNDAGNQINKFGVSLSVRYQQQFKGEENVPLPADAYQGADIIDRAKEYIALYGDKLLNITEEERQEELIDFALPINIKNLEDDLKKYRIVYDNWFLESVLHNEKQLDLVIAILEQKGLTYIQDGALFYKSSEFGSEKDEVLVRANGVPTYFAADIAYHYNKFAIRKFDKVINIWGADHHGHVARLKGAMDAVGLNGDDLDIVLMQLVKLVKDGELYKVSKRTGKSITLSNLLEEVPIDAARFFFNMREANSQMDFDLDLAVEKSSENPVYYVQYAHARICSIIAKLETEGVKLTDLNECDFSLLTQSEEIEIIRHIATLPTEINQAAISYDPARITRYCITLATLFHKFYNACRVSGEEENLTKARLGLCLTVKTVLSNLLEMLKIDAPTSM